MAITNYSEMADAKLVAMAQNGDKEAFGELYRRYVDRIFNYVFGKVGNQQDAEDLTALTFFKALDKLSSYRPTKGGTFQAWLYRIGHNLMANYHRSKSRRPQIALDDLWHAPTTPHSPHHFTEKNELREALTAAIGKLPETQREVVLLKLVDELTNAQIGEILGKSESSIKSLYFRAVKKLRQDLVGFF